MCNLGSFASCRQLFVFPKISVPTKTCASDNTGQPNTGFIEQATVSPTHSVMIHSSFADETSLCTVARPGGSREAEGGGERASRWAIAEAAVQQIYRRARPHLTGEKIIHPPQLLHLGHDDGLLALSCQRRCDHKSARKGRIMCKQKSDDPTCFPGWIIL